MAAILALTGAAAVAGALDPGLAAGGHPHPTLTGTVGEAASILLNNLRALAAPFLLIIVRFPAARITGAIGDVAIGAILTVNCVTVGIQLGRWQGRLLPYLPHLPLEFSALACSTCAWLIARDDTKRRRELTVLALATIALLIGAACLETWATPHRSPRSAVSDSRVDTPSDQRAPRRVAVVVCLRPDFARRRPVASRSLRSLPLTKARFR